MEIETQRQGASGMGTVEEENDKSRKSKTRVNMFVDTDVIDVLREEAAKDGIGYQTLINKTLREVFVDKRKKLKFEEAISDIEAMFRDKVGLINTQYHEVYKKIEELEKGAVVAAKKKWDDIQERIKMLEKKVKMPGKKKPSSTATTTTTKSEESPPLQ